MKKIILVLSLLLITTFVNAKDLVVFKNEYNILKLKKPLKKITVGNKDLINVSFLYGSRGVQKDIKVFGKTAGSTSLMLIYKDNSIDNYHVYINENLGFIQKMVNQVAPNITLQRVGDGATVVNGTFETPHKKRRVFKILASAGIEANSTMDLSEVEKVEKMVRTKLYLVEIDNARAKELGGAVGLGYVGDTANVALNSGASTAATFSGFLLDNTGNFARKGSSLSASLKFLQGQQVANIMDDTVLLTTEEQNASFHVGGDVYIPTGITFNGTGSQPLIQVTEREYGLRLTLKTYLLEKDGFVHMAVTIKSSEFDNDPDHEVQLGQDIVVPAFISKNIKTDIVSKHGNVIALGGRMHTESIKQESKIPLLGDLPLIGWMFRSDTSAKIGKDLIFFLVPEIVDGNDVVDESNFYEDFQNDSAKRWNIIFKDNNRTLDVRNMNDKKVIQDDWSSEKCEDDEEEHEEDIIDEEDGYEEEVIAEVEKETVVPEVVAAPIVVPTPAVVVPIAVITPVVSTPKTKYVAPKNETEEVVEEIAIVNRVALVKQSDKARLQLMANGRVVKMKKSIINKPKHSKVVKKEKLVESIVDQKVEKVTKKSTSKVMYYKVKNDNSLVKSSAKNGFQIDVWDKGHKFSAVKGVKVDGEVWIKVKEDCMHGCEETGVPLWIKKKDTSLEKMKSEKPVTDKESFDKLVKKPVAKTEEQVKAMVESKKVNKRNSISENVTRYEVSTKRIFIRNAPKDGKKVDIWGQNHPFTSEVSEVVDGVTWLKIKEDCRGECVVSEKELWISQRFTSEL